MNPTDYEEIPEAILTGVKLTSYPNYELSFTNIHKEVFIMEIYADIMWKILQGDKFKSIFDYDIGDYKDILRNTKTYTVSLLVARYDSEEVRKVIGLGLKDSIFILDNSTEIDKEYFKNKDISDKLQSLLPEKNIKKSTKI